MAIPEKPLEVDFDPAKITLDEMCLFEEDGFSFTGFRRFLVEHTNWSRAEIGKLTAAELQDVAAQLKAQIEEKAVPLAS